MKKIETWKKNFFKIMIGQSLSLITSSIVQYAIIWYIAYQTKSAFWLSLATIIGFIPQGILGLFIGSYIDKRNRKRIMIISDLFIALVSLILVIYGLFNELPIWLIFIALGLRSIGNAFHNPSLQASIPLIVPENKLLKYSGYIQSMQSVSLILSPAIAALLYGRVNLAIIILLDFFGAIFAFITLFISDIPSPHKDKFDNINFWEESKAGFKVIIKNKTIRYIFIISAFYILLYMPISSLFPLITISYFDKTPFHSGVVETLFAVGMLLGGISLANNKIFKNKRRNIIISILLMGISLLISGLLNKEQFIFFTILSIIMGFSGPIIQATINTIFAEELSQDYLGRIYSNYTSLIVVVMPLGLLLSGMFADKIGINIWFLITGVLIIILSLCVSVNRSFLKEQNNQS